MESKESRSWNMSRIRSKNTKPELIIRKLLYRNGFRYRLHVPSLPGKPDIVFFKAKKVIYVNGCFWHGHDCKRGCYVPKTNTEYWRNKIQSNKQRMNNNIELMQSSGWRVLILWECQLKDIVTTEEVLINFLS